MSIVIHCISCSFLLCSSIDVQYLFCVWRRKIERFAFSCIADVLSEVCLAINYVWPKQELIWSHDVITPLSLTLPYGSRGCAVGCLMPSLFSGATKGVGGKPTTILEITLKNVLLSILSVALWAGASICHSQTEQQRPWLISVSFAFSRWKQECRRTEGREAISFSLSLYCHLPLLSPVIEGGLSSALTCLPENIEVIHGVKDVNLSINKTKPLKTMKCSCWPLQIVCDLALVCVVSQRVHVWVRAGVQSPPSPRWQG